MYYYAYQLLVMKNVALDSPVETVRVVMEASVQAAKIKKATGRTKKAAPVSQEAVDKTGKISSGANDGPRYGAVADVDSGHFSTSLTVVRQNLPIQWLRENRRNEAFPKAHVREHLLMVPVSN